MQPVESLAGVIINDEKFGSLKRKKCILLILEARSLKSQGQQEHAPFEVSREGYFQASSNSGNPRHPWLVAASLQSLPLSLGCLLLCLSVSSLLLH